MNANNVVIFPGNKNGKFQYIPPKDVEEIKENIEKVRVEQVEETAQFLLEILQENIKATGFEFDFLNDKLARKEMALIVEGIRGLLYHHYHIEHPAHVIAEEFFEADDNGSVTYKLEKPEKSDLEQDEIFTLS